MTGIQIGDVSDARLYISIARCFLALHKISKRRNGHVRSIALLWIFIRALHFHFQVCSEFNSHLHNFLPCSVFCLLPMKDKTEDPSVIVEKEVTESVSGSPKDVQTNKVRENIVRVEPSRQIDMAGEISMEASMSADDVLRAGGFGARDDIGCFLPVASDSTDFEATILNARDYEGPQGEISRPGLGWKEATKAE